MHNIVRSRVVCILLSVVKHTVKDVLAESTQFQGALTHTSVEHIVSCSVDDGSTEAACEQHAQTEVAP